MLFVSNAAYRFPGLGKAVDQGQLIPTQEIMHHLNAKKMDGTIVSNDFVEKFTGFKTISLTHTTLNFLRNHIWSLSKDFNETKHFSLQMHTNENLYSMLEDSIKQVLSNNSEAKNLITRHIHLGADNVYKEAYQLDILRKKLGFPIPIVTEFSFLGCPTPIYILNQLNRQKIEEETYVLMTASRNHLLYAHQYRLEKEYATNIEYWSTIALFCEGVAALLIHLVPDELQHAPHEFKLIDSQIKPLLHLEPEAWRTKPAADGRSRLLNVKRIRETYFPAIPHLIAETFEKLEQRSGHRHNRQEILESILAYGLHESNTLWIEELALKQNIPLEIIPRVSQDTGSPGALSPFVTIAKAIEQSVIYPNKPFIIQNSIGQADATIISGYLIFERQHM